MHNNLCLLLLLASFACDLKVQQMKSWFAGIVAAVAWYGAVAVVAHAANGSYHSFWPRHNMRALLSYDKSFAQKSML